MRPDRPPAQLEQSRGLSIRSRHPNRKGWGQYHKQSPNTMHRSKSGKGSSDGRGIHRLMQGSGTQPRIQAIQATREDYEWLIALANLYDQGWPAIPHRCPEGNESKTQALKIKTTRANIQGREKATKQ